MYSASPALPLDRALLDQRIQLAEVIVPGIGSGERARLDFPKRVMRMFQEKQQRPFEGAASRCLIDDSGCQTFRRGRQRSVQRRYAAAAEVRHFGESVCSAAEIFEPDNSSKKRR